MNDPSEPRTVPSVDLARYLGTWYEIARLPMRYEDADFTDITANYSLNADGSVRVDNQARNGKGEWEESIGEATVVKDSGNAKLKVSFMPGGLRWIPFTKGDYWILQLDEAYQSALVGSPDRKYLWLLSRQPVLQESQRVALMATAREQGFDLSNLVQTSHTGRG